MHRLPPYFSMTKDNTSTIMHLVPRPPFPPPLNFALPLLLILLGITVVPKKVENNGYTKFFFLGGEGEGVVNKVLYGLCENSEFHSFLVLNMRRLLRLQTFYLFIGIKYKCLSQSCFSIYFISTEIYPHRWQ